MAKAKIPVEFDPVITSKVDAALARIQSKAKGIDFGGGARSLDKLSRPLGKITGQADEFEKSLNASNARVLAFGASVAVINKLSQAFSALIANTVKVEATFAKINTILGGTDKQLRQFGDGIFKVAQKTATSFDEVSEGALELARQGLSVEESLSRVETALKLVRVAGVSSEQAVAGLTAAIKGFEGAGLTVAAIGDKLSEVDTKFAVSTEDLINGLERASASARVAGVSFDELLAVVTTVQERTQRGGAVIGNAFKTIFARLGRTDTLSALEELGINVLDTQGNVRSAIPLFQELAGELNKLGLKSVEAGDIIQKVAGVRQRDILISLVEDLNSSQSQFSKALQTSATAAGALDSKNNSLNQTLEALINNLTVGGQKLASVLGELGFTDSVKDILKVFSSVVNGLSDLLQGDSLGAKFAQGIVKGIGGVLTGPGLALVGAIFIKLFVDLAKFGAKSLASLLGINKAAQQQAALQQSVLQTLFQNENIQREILALEGNKVAQEQLLLKIYNQQAAALARVQKAAATVTPTLFGAGFRGGTSGVGKTGRGASGYVAAEARDVSRGVGGAPTSSKVVSIPNFAFGGGKRGTMVANTSEYFVPNYAGGGDAIFNQNMVKAMGLPAGAKKINAAGGFIPNFAVAPSAFQDFMRSRGITPRQLRSTNYDSAYSGGRYREEFDSLSPLEQRNISKTAAQRAQLKRQKGAGAKAEFGIMYSDVIGGTKATNLLTPGKNTIKAIPVDTEPPNKLYKDLRDGMVKSAVVFAQTLGFQPDIIQDNKFKKAADKSLNPGAVEGAFGTVFEAAFQGALGISQKSNSIFDLPSATAISQLVAKGKAGGIIESIGGNLLGLKAVDVKNALNVENIKSIDNKIRNRKMKRGASGYIPNFAGGALDEAVAREQAAGLPINQIRINQSGKLRNSQNPMGLAVTNTRDEPTGAIPNFAKRGAGGAEESINKFSSAALGASTSLFFLSSAFSGAESGVGKFISELTLAASLLSGLSLLKGPLENVGAKLSSFGAELATFRSPRTGGIMRGSEGKLRGARGSLGRGIAGVGRALPGIGTAVAIGAVVAPLVLELTKTKTGFEKLNESIKNIDLGELSAGSKEASASLKSAFAAEVKRANERAQLTKKLGVEEDANIKDIIDAQLKGLTGIDRGFFGGVKDKETLSASLAKIGDKNVLQSIILESQAKTDRNLQDEFGSVIEGAFEVEFDPVLFAKNMIIAIDKIDAAAKKAAETALITEAGFGEGAVTGATAKRRFKESIDQGKFAAAGFGEGGPKSAIREKELELAKAVTTTRKIGLENEIALKKFLVEKAEEEFRITEDYVKSIKDSSVFSAKQKEFIDGRVKSGRDLLSIELDLQKLGIELTGQAKTDFDLAVGKAENQRKVLKDKYEEIKLQQEINNLNKPQGFGEGIRKGLGNLENDIAFFGDELGENIPIQFSDNLGSAMQEAVSGAKDLDDALSDAGRNFLGFIRDAFLQQAASQLTSGIFGSSTGQGGLFGGGSAAADGGLFGGIKSLFGGKSGASSPDGTPTNPIYTASSASGTNPVDALTGGEKGEGIFAKLKSTLTDSFGTLKTTFSDLFGSLKDNFASIFKNLTSNLSNLFTSGGGGGGGGFFRTVLGAFGFGFANGGPVGFANGGSVGSTDTVPAMLTPGEFVMKKSAVEKYGSGFLSSINEGVMPMRGFQNGGVVGPVSAEAGTGYSVGSPTTNNSDFTFNIQDGTAEQTGGQNNTDQQREFAQKVKAAVTTVVQEESRTGGTLSYLYKK